MMRLGAACTALAFAALIGTGPVQAATAGAMTQSMTAKCDARADKKKLTGDARDSYVNKCTTHASAMKAKRMAAKKAAPPASQATQPQG